MKRMRAIGLSPEKTTDAQKFWHIKLVAGEEGISTDPLNCMHGPHVPGGIRWVRGLIMRAAVVVEVVLRPNTECAGCWVLRTGY